VGLCACLCGCVRACVCVRVCRKVVFALGGCFDLYFYWLIKVILKWFYSHSEVMLKGGRALGCWALQCRERERELFVATKSAAQEKTVHSATRAYRLTHKKFAYVDMFTHTHMDICTSLCLLPPPSLSLLIPVYPFLPLSYCSRCPCNSSVVIVQNTPSRFLGRSAADTPVTVVYKSTDKPELNHALHRAWTSTLLRFGP